MMGSRKTGLGCLVAAGLALVASATEAQDRRVVVAANGGAYEQMLREHWFDPFTEATGIRVITDVAGGQGDRRARLQAMIDTGNMQWDLVQQNEMDAEAADHFTRFEDVSAFCARFEGRDDLAGDACTASGMLLARGAVLLAFNTEAFPDGGPQTWADFWDIETYPGTRALPAFSDPWRVLLPALLADGVPPDALFPLDVDRAFRSLDQIRDHVSLWWTTGDQTVQGFRSGEFDMAAMWLTRSTALQAEGQPIDWSFDGALFAGDRYGVSRDAPNRDEALELIAFYLNTPEVQAGFCEALACAPPSLTAPGLMSREARDRLPSAPDVLASLVVPDGAWLVANRPMLVERWNAWIQQ